jgi:Protein of unknown function (DUF4238)
MSDPRNHHFIAKWHQRYWSHGKDQVNAIILRGTPRIKAITTNIINLNVKRDLYSLKSKGDDVDVRLETELYSKLDSDACELTNEIISTLKGGDTPKLDVKSRRLLWLFYVYHSLKRHPIPVKNYLDKSDRSKDKEYAIKSLIEEGRNSSDVLKAFEGIETNKDVNDEIIWRVRASSPGKNVSPILNADVTFVLAAEGSSFVLPDRTYEVGEERHSPLQGIWIPIHPKYAIKLVWPNEQAMVLLLDKRGVRRLNEHWYIMSKTVISTSKKLLVSLARNVDRQKISFE